jgi:hypothetical protein
VKNNTFIFKCYARNIMVNTNEKVSQKYPFHVLVLGFCKNLGFFPKRALLRRHQILVRFSLGVELKFC